MSMIEKEVLLKAIYDPSFAKGAFSELPLSAFSEREEYKEIYQSIKQHYMLRGTPLTERILIHEVEDRLGRRNTKEEKIAAYTEVVHDLYTIERSSDDDNIVDARINEFVRGKLVYKAVSDFLTSSDDLGNEKELNKLVPELQRITTMNVNGDEEDVVDFFEDVDKKKEEYSKLEKDKFQTGFKVVDKISGGGLARGEVGMIIASTGGGKCITGDSLITTGKGFIKIQEIPGYYKVAEDTGESEALVASYNTDGEYVPRNTSHWFNMGFSKTIKITTKYGYEIEGTPEHPLLVQTEDGSLEFVELQDMFKGDRITLATPDMWSKNDLVDPQTAYIMGLTAGLSTEDTGAEILSPVLRSTKETILQYLHGLIDIKGTLDDKGFLRVDLTERKVAKQAQTLMLNMGVPAKRTEHPYRDTVTLLLEPDATSTLLTNMKFKPVDYSVISNDDMNEDKLNTCVSSHLSRVFMGEQESLYHNYPKEQGIGTKKMARMLDNFFFDEIEKIEESEAEVYDFTVPETHSFVANGIVSHNTTWAVQQLNNYTKRGMNTLYIALEEHLGRMLLKIEQNMLGVSKRELFDENGSLKEEVFDGAQEIYKESMNLGKMFIAKRRPQEVTISDIEQIILNLKFRRGVTIDAVVIDYPDLMKNPHLARGSSESDAGGKLLEDIRALADKHKYVCWVLSQLNRDGWGQDIKTAQSIEGSKRKLNAVEVAFTLNQTSKEFEHGVLRIHIDKMRYSDDKEGFSRIQYFKLEREGLRIRDESPEEIEHHKSLIGDTSEDAPTKREVANNKKVIDRIANINSVVGGQNG